LEDFPQLEEREQNSALAGLRPEMSSDDFQRWESGQTGYPLVDACLRSVHATGYLNFRMRAMLMSFATHLMWRDWRQPAWDLARAFLDFEPGIHFAQVQMQASVTGNNQIRIYNPLKQSLENDPHGTFIKQWVPELRDVDAGRIHALEGLPSRYPRPIVDLNLATASAKETLFKRFSESDVRIAAKQVQERLGSRSGVRSWRRKKATKSAPSKSKPKKDNDSDITLFDLPGS
jgi:deoxyribodipyrimidine photo-lyase